jgi:hypothetical protein
MGCSRLIGEDEARAVRQHPDATCPIAKLRTAAFPTATQIAAIRHDRFTSIRDVAQTSQMRKEQPFPDGLANLWIDPKATFGFEASRSESERKRSSREGTIAT